MAQAFFGGVHPNDMKAATNEKAIEQLAPPAVVVIPMSMHFGAPCTPLVKAGDHVKVGQKIGEIAGLGAPIHASVSGVVKAVEPRPYVGGGKVMSVVIENDFQDTWGSVLTPHPDYSKLSCEEIVEIVKEAGITGMGGAGFPTAVKLSPKNLDEIDTLLINGAECEPYITSDNRCFLEDTHHVLGGIKAVMKYLNIPKCIIGIEGNKPEAIAKMKAAIDAPGIEVKQLPCRYPQGAEKVLIENCTGREVPFPGLPSDVGVIVMNVTSVAFVSKYLETGMPLTTKRLTVDGDAVNQAKNVEVVIGTPIEEVLEFCGGVKEDFG